MKHCPECGWPTKVNETRTMDSNEIYRLRVCANKKCAYRTRTVETAVEWSSLTYARNTDALDTEPDTRVAWRAKAQ